MKIIFFFALLAIAASSASRSLMLLLKFTGDISYSRISCCNNRCSAHAQCSTLATPFFQSPVFQHRNCKVMQQRCCQQLRMIMQQSHYQAINITQAQAQALLALNLPSICGIYQRYNSAPYSIPTVGGVWY
uniref:Bifunctional inhibitor/plant lipid transfer protein/seed storage helical domain-containing protein n=1 Tax=Oryza punctata TaxID=4537 RepID=A0A0E0ML82_ORYPU